MAKGLWPSDDAVVWEQHLQKYDDAVDATGKERLAELDRWFQTELPVSISGRDKPYLSKDDLVKLVDWKLTRGKWRPRLLDFAKQQAAGVVEQASEAAFAALQKGTDAGAKEALDTLAKLKGVGPATASAALAAASDQVPFMSDEALETVVGGRNYTVKEFLLLHQRVKDKASALSKASGRQWTAREVEKALWAADILAKGTSSKGTKRKAAATSSRPATGGTPDGDKADADGGKAVHAGSKRGADEPAGSAKGTSEGGLRRSKRTR